MFAIAYNYNILVGINNLAELRCAKVQLDRYFDDGKCYVILILNEATAVTLENVAFFIVRKCYNILTLGHVT